MVKIFIDPGHGGSDPGAVANGLKEKDLTLNIAQKIARMLEEYVDVQVKLSRESDVTLPLSHRTAKANNWGADFLLSIHVNAGGGTGFESYIYDGKVSNQTIQAQNEIHASVMNAIAKYGVRDRGKKRKNLHMVRESKMPALLTETLFIDNPADVDLLKREDFLNDVARGHVEGLARTFKLVKKVPFKKAKTYRLKTGTFSNRADAEAAKKKIEDTFGYIVYIVEGD